jgi:hypothetical protein
MTNQKHTPGPWRICRLDNGTYSDIVGSDDVCLIGIVDGQTSAEVIWMNDADATLCAAAPDLLALLIESDDYAAHDGTCAELSGHGIECKFCDFSRRRHATIAKAKRGT